MCGASKGHEWAERRGSDGGVPILGRGWRVDRQRGGGGGWGLEWLGIRRAMARAERGP